MSRAILSGINVLDFSQLVAGPRCTRMLADLGADVVVVERIPSAERARVVQLPYERVGKRSIALDLKHAEASRVARALVAQADIVVENFAPGTMDSLGLAYPQLAVDHPQLVYVSVSGFGQEGSFRDRRAFGAVAHAESGFLWLQQQARGDGAPFAPGLYIADLAAGLYAFGATLAALYDRAQTGEGQHIDLTLMDGLLSLMGGEAHALLNDDRDAWRPFVHPIHRSSDGRYFTMTLATPEVRQRVGRIIGAPDPDPLSASQHAGAWVAEHTGDEVIEAFERHGAPYGRVMSIPEALEHPYFEERGMIIEVAHPYEEDQRTLRSPLFFSRADPPAAAAIPAVGEHTRDILSGLLGYDDRRIDELVSSKAVSEAG
jgi:crotonobetainyl-CoA:carnitine CoA-transferase CaiB-like acyl-CoA transferase